MKRFICVLIALLCCAGLFAERYKNEIYRNIDYSYQLFMYEIFNENKELIYYEIMTSQNFFNPSIFYIRSYDKKILIKFLNDLRKCEDKDFKKYITNYAENNTNLVFLWDDYRIVDKYIEEYFCYELKQ